MKVIGIMSGTSLDGVDMIYVDFDNEEVNQYKILAAKTYPYSAEQKKKLYDAFHFDSKQLMELHVDFGSFLGRLVKKFISEFDLPAPDWVSSHGHTIFHEPLKGYSFQIGHGAYLMASSNLNTVCDFRPQDIALGGMGAPFAPIGDKLLFGDYDYCLNIGGFANVSYEDEEGKRKAHDIVAANFVLNAMAGWLGKPYDEGGRMARQGKIIKDLFNELKVQSNLGDLKLSLGREFVEEKIFPILNKFSTNIYNLLRTYVEFIASEIATSVGKGRMLITGGGAYNDFLIERIKALSETEIIIPDKMIVDFKEALIFALMGYLRVKNKVNVLASVTGARKDHSTGVIYLVPE